MKTQCPNCKAVQDVPEHYAHKEIKCLKCQKGFIAAEYKPIIIDRPPKIKRDESEFLAPPSSTMLNILAFLAIIISLFAAVASESVIVFIVGVGGGFLLVGLAEIVDSLRGIFLLLRKISQNLPKK